jgi:type I restriction enzyme S subunit
VNWPEVPLLGLCNPKQWPTLSMAQMAKVGFPVFGANGPIGFADSFTHPHPVILIGCRGSCGSLHITPPQVYANGNAMALDDLDSTRVDIRYLYYYFCQRGFQDVISGSSQPQITRQGLSRVVVPLPPLPEQRRIADILDKADSIRRKRKEAIALTEALLRSAFLEMFGDPVTNPKGWPVRKLGDVAALYAGNSLPSGTAFVGQSDGYLLLKVGDMNMSGNESEIAAAREWISRLPSSAVAAPAGCVVIPKRGGAIATNKKRVLQRAAALDPNLMAIEPLEGLRLEYLREWFSMIDLGSLSNGSSVPQLNKKDLMPLVVAQPPLAVQDRFVQFSRLVRRRSESLSASAIAGELLFNSLVARAFTGTLESP